MQKRAVYGFTLWSYLANLGSLLCETRPLVLGMKTAAYVSIYTCIYSLCLWLLVSVSLPLKSVRLNTVCCLKETELMANDIWQRPSVMVMWYGLRAAEACLRDVVWPWTHARKQKTGHIQSHTVRQYTFVKHQRFCHTIYTRVSISLTLLVVLDQEQNCFIVILRYKII